MQSHNSSKRYLKSKKKDYQKQRSKRYRAILENLAALLVDPKGYYNEVQSFLSDQYRWRVSRAIAGTLFLIIAILILIIAISLLIMSAYFFLEEQLNRPAVSALILGWVAVLIFFLFYWLSIKRYNDVTGRRH